MVFLERSCCFFNGLYLARRFGFEVLQPSDSSKSLDLNGYCMIVTFWVTWVLFVGDRKACVSLSSGCYNT